MTNEEKIEKLKLGYDRYIMYIEHSEQREIAKRENEEIVKELEKLGVKDYKGYE